MALSGAGKHWALPGGVGAGEAGPIAGADMAKPGQSGRARRPEAQLRGGARRAYGKTQAPRARGLRRMPADSNLLAFIAQESRPWAAVSPSSKTSR
jgi:hypothetical protein